MVSLRVNLAQPTRHRNRFRRVGAVKPGPSKHNTCANAWRDVRVGALPAPRLFRARTPPECGASPGVIRSRFPPLGY